MTSDVWRDRIKPFLAGLSSALVVMLAFLIPSLQELWDRVETRRAVDRYVEIGQRLSAHEKFTAAEEAFGRALELGGNQRHDLLELKLRARVQRIVEDPEWPGAIPADITESDFLYLLETEAAPTRARDRAASLTAYAAYLAIGKRWADSEQALQEAIGLDRTAAEPLVSLGNLQSDIGKSAEAEASYRHALQLQPANANAHYNLGLLLLESGRAVLAEGQFQEYTRLRPADPLGWHRLAESLTAQHKTAAARKAYETVLHLNPHDSEARAALAATP